MKILFHAWKGRHSACLLLLFVLSLHTQLHAQQAFVCNDMVTASLQANCMTVIDADQILEGGPYCCYQNYIVEVDNTPAGTNCDGPWVPAVLGITDVGQTYCIRVRDPLFPGIQCFGQIQIVNNIGPNISCPADQAFVADPGICGHVGIANDLDPLSFGDNCPGVALTYRLNDVNGNVLLGTGSTTLNGIQVPVGTTRVRWTATDADNNTASCSFTVQITDTQVPVITCPADQVRTADANDLYTTVNTEFDPLTYFDNCPTYPVSSSVTGATNDGTNITLGGTVFNVGQSTVTWTLLESQNLNLVYSTCTFQVDVQSSRLPVYIPNITSGNVSAVDPVTNVLKATISTGAIPGVVKMSPDGSRVYVVNRGSNNVSVINTATNTVTNTIAVGYSPVSAAINSNGSRLYVSNLDGNNVSVINTVTNTVLATVGVGTHPNELRITPDGSKVFVLNASSHSISVIGASTNSVIGTIGLGVVPFDLEISPNGARLYVSNINSGTISVINTATDAVVANVSMGAATSSLDLVVTPDNSKVYVTLQYNSVPQSVGVINTATNTLLTDINVNPQPEMLCISPDGSRLYVSCMTTNTVSVVNTATNTFLNNITVGTGRTAQMATTPDGARLLVLNPVSNTVSTINTADNSVLATTTLGITPVGISNFPSYSSLAACSLVSCPVNRNVNLNASCQMVVPDLIPEFLVTGGCSAFTQIPAAGTIINTAPNLTQNVSLTVTGTGSSCSVVLTAKDIIPPTVICPVNKTRNTTSNQCAYVTSGAEFNPLSFSDNCSGSNINYTLSGATTGNGANTLAGVAFNKGVTNILWTVLQAGGALSNTCGPFTLTVSDNQAPGITCPVAQTRSTSATSCNYTAVAAELNPLSFTDNCPSVTISYTLSGVTAGSGNSLAGKVFNQGITTVNWKATDAANKTATCTFKITVIDNQPPVFAVCPTNPIVVPMTQPCKLIVPSIATITTDNCSINITKTQVPAANTILSAVHNQSFTVVITAKDAAGNTSTCTRTLTASDQTKPTITTCPANRTVALNGSCQLQVPDMRSQLVATDCTLPITVSQYPAQLTLLASGNSMQHVVTMTATDGPGNTKTCSVTLTAQFHTGCFAGGEPVVERMEETAPAPTDDWKVSPNPFTDELKVFFNLDKEDQVELVVLDLSGKTVFHQQKTWTEGMQTIPIDTHDWPGGVYFVGLKKESRKWDYKKVMLVR